MRLINPLFSASRNGVPRSPQREPVPFKMLLPLQLKDSVSSKNDRTREAACLQEMTLMFACFKKAEFNQERCMKEINAFRNCYSDFTKRNAIQREQEKKGILVPGEKKLTHKQVNQLLKKFPATRPFESKA